MLAPLPEPEEVFTQNAPELLFGVAAPQEGGYSSLASGGASIPPSAPAAIASRIRLIQSR